MKTKLNVGMFVKSRKNTNIFGKIIDINKSILTIENNSIMIKMKTNDAEVLKNNIYEKFTKKFPNKQKNINFNFKPEIDLHGLTKEQAIEKLDKFIDNALSTGHSFLKIIHGKGKGILRSLTNSLLSKDPRVKHINDNHMLQGGSGVTWVELK